MDFSSIPSCAHAAAGMVFGSGFDSAAFCLGIPFDAQLSAASWTIELGGLGLDVPTT
jgi:hypothetical protein